MVGKSVEWDISSNANVPFPVMKVCKKREKLNPGMVCYFQFPNLHFFVT